jgi:hypothetical protein
MRGAFCGLLLCALFACQEPAGPDELRITGVSPPLGVQDGGTSVVLRGTGFTAGTTVLFGDSPATEVRIDSDTEITVVTPRGPARPGEVAVTASRTDGSTAKWSDRFTYYWLDLAQTPELLRAPSAVAMAPADWDRDGRTDVAVATTDPAGVVLLGGQPDGGLAYVRRYDAARRPVGITAADVNGDGLDDLLVLDGADPSVAILRGRGSALGDFVAGLPLPLSCPPTAIAAGDVDGNKRVDLVVTCEASGALLFRNMGERADGLGPQFASPQPLAGGSSPVAAIIADLDHDGARDIGVLSAAGRLYLHFGDGGGGLLPVQDVPAGQAPAGLLAMDVTEDGKNELIIADRSGGLMVLKATGQGLLTRWQRPTGPAGASLVAPIGSRELTHVVLLRSDNGEGSRYLLEDANLIKPLPIALKGPLAALLGADLDGDGSRELLALESTPGALSIYRSTGGELRRERLVSLLPAPRGAVAADVNGDGWMDAAWIGAGSSAVQVRSSLGDGSFEPPRSYPTAAGPVGIGVADLNGDRSPDLVVTCPRAETSSVLITIAPKMFQAAFDLMSGPQPELLALVDVSGDAKSDLVVTSQGGSELRVLLGRGNGTFDPPRLVPIGGAARALLTTDLGDDGKRDVLVLAGDGLRVLRGRGDGSFEAAVRYEAGDQPQRFLASDTNLDGVRDLAVLGPGELRLLLGHPDGSFALVQRIPVAPAARHLAVLDADRDGDLDLVIADEQRPELGILLGRPDGTLLPPLPLPIGLAPSGLLTMDTDGNQVSDLLVVGPAGQTLLRSRLFER